MRRSFTIPSRFHPAYSLLGRWIRRRLGDRRAAESTYVVAAAALGVVLVLSQYLAWAYLYPMSTAALSNFLIGEIAVAVLYAAGALIGRQPPIHLQLDDEILRIRRGEDELVTPYAEIGRVSIISSETYYGHYARYAATRAFVNRIRSNLLMLECPRRPIVLGLKPAELLEVERILGERVDASYSSSRVGAA